ncbi:F0F1 ATP synthase subunit delta [Undibacterium sp. 5I1]|uniref:F0F1 ATP synthase subunit delta n=1 Tax=unclassified Undibacterium TaxID=2630295 RepID=UPI002AB566E4|nr:MULTISPECIES: F0F1 ATP synthase subunit delta [unclassified Undibacterium]MDY7539698.1 F0F1 ATP synthase subunit delta [Undibacterium sp. 5I1]MEB0230872.1 F0F1 ATP synthase subunit delta [Undibacterium sp. 10I3]MEB0257473.1 F0F1 ATP synthase subunit delta [Undibacterium sp. 5I1]
MAELATIARPYAEALFRVAQSGNLSAWSDLVAEMAQAAAHPDVVALAHNPKVSAVQTAEAFLSVLKSPVNEEAKNFVNTLTEYDRLTLLPEIAAQFHALKNAQEGAADAQITSAFELTAEQVSDLATTLEKKFGRKLHPTVTVDNSLIGGVRIVVGDQVLDTSVRAKLQQMQVALTA